MIYPENNFNSVEGSRRKDKKQGRDFFVPLDTHC